MVLSYGVTTDNNSNEPFYNPYAPADERQVSLTTEGRLKFRDHVNGLFHNSQAYFRPFQAQCAKADDYYHGRNVVPVPTQLSAQMDAVKPAKARSIINIATDHVDVSNLEIDIPAAPRAKARAERLKKFYQGVWLNIKGPVLRTAIRHSFTYGIAWLKPMFNADQWPKAPTIDQYIIGAADDGELVYDEEAYVQALKDVMEDRQIKFPFALKNVNPKNLLWDDSRAKRQWAIEYYHREARDTRRRYPEWVSEKGANEIVSWLEYWDEKYCGYMADGDWVWGPYEHSYGFMPLIPIIPASSLDWDTGKVHERYQGLLQPIYSLLDAHARITTAYEAILRQYAWQTLDFIGPAHGVEEAMSNYEMFGSMNALPAGVEVKASPRIVPPQELLQYLQVIETLIEEATFPNVIRGVRPKGVSSGYQVSILAGMGRLVFQGVADGAARAVEQINSGWASLVENRLRSKVTVYARSDIHNFDQTIGPDDIKGLYENKVVMTAQAPEEREREALLAIKLQQARLLSRYEAMRRAGTVNPLDEMVQMRAEELVDTPEMFAEQARIAQEGVRLLSQLAQAVDAPSGTNTGNQFDGLSQLPRPGEASIQAARLASRDGTPSVFPNSLSAIDQLAGNLGTPRGGAVNVPSGQTVRRGG